MARWTRFVLRLRWPILGFWLAVLIAGGWSFTRLSALLSNSFSVPGTASEEVRTILQSHFGDRSDGSFTVVFQAPDAAQRLPALQARVDRAAHAVPTGQPRQLRVAAPDLLYGDVSSRLSLSAAKGFTDDLLHALGPVRGGHVYVTGPAAIQHDLDPIFSRDLKKGEMIALPIAFAVLVAVFGISLAVTIPFLFAACSIMGTLGLVFVFAHYATTATYVTNLVFLIGLGIAIDYSLLVAYRFREELARGVAKQAAIVRTMETAGRAVVFSGLTVAIGLGLLLFMPLPFMRSIGVGGFLIPLLSVLAALTLQPVLLDVYGRAGMRRFVFGGRPGVVENRFWARLARAIMHRPLRFLAFGVAILLAAAAPVYALRLTPGSAEGIPRSPQSVQGFDLLKAAVGPGVISPSLVLADAGASGRVLRPDVQAAIARLVRDVRGDPEVATAFYRPGGRFVDPSRRYAQVIIAGRHDYGEEPSQSFVHRLRRKLIPAARFPTDVRVLAGGGPPQGVDFLARAYGIFPYLVVGVLLLTYVLLMRAFRSVLLPLKAVALNLLSVSAAYGMLVVFFPWGAGRSIGGLYQIGQVEGWIPIFLFAMLFGLSMDYEVFMVTRMREGWDERGDNTWAVAHGLERTGRIVTAAAIVMVAAFSGFVAGSIVGLQEFGLGLAVAIFVDATIVRALLVPSLMALFGRWNWWLPATVARVVRVPASPLAPAALRASGN